MRCPQCDYRLWNLTTRACPECGRPFKPTDFEFLPHTVAFCCPHCDQPYYGQSDKGHLIPPEFDCVQCGRRLHMDQMVLRPAPGLEEEQTSAVVNPWFDPRHTRFFRRYLAALWQGFAHPGLAVEGVPPDASRLRATAYLCLNFGLFLAISALFIILAVQIVSLFSRGRINDPEDLILVPIFTILVCVLAGLLGSIIWSLTLHGTLYLLRCRPTRSLHHTYTALAMTSGVHALTVAPLCGPYLASLTFPAWLILTVIAVHRTQRTPAVRTALAALTLPLLLTLALGAAGLWATYQVANHGRYLHTKSVAYALAHHGLTHHGQLPAHAIALVMDQSLNPHDLIAPGSKTTLATIPVGSTTLDQFIKLSPADQQSQAASAIAFLPPDVVAHRLGDFVFTYHGMNLSTAPSDAWIVISYYDSTINKNFPHTFYAACVDGHIQTLNHNTFSSELQAQNQLRAKAGLPPLPDPRFIRHGLPMSASLTPPNFPATQPHSP
ncbi:MAG: hypothetical protein IT442_04280 [Phycisphaeraceae bacterium]|nr:hypothetical protein [Phycisphaeraceae bacterium]